MTVIAGALVVILTGAVLSHNSAPAAALTAKISGSAQTSQGKLPHAYLNIATYPDSMAGEHGPTGGKHPDWVSYGPSSVFHVPAHALVTMTIRQYDSGEELNNPFFATVRGTVGGTMTLNGKTVSKVDWKHIGHTFTLHAAPGDQDPLFVSVPLPALSDEAEAKLAKGSDYPKPNVIRFSFITGGPGHYVWNCEYPCGDGYYAKFGGPMSTGGYMSGTLIVE
jgi:uncharacterized protein YaiE (UPF0345 family)